MVPAPLRSTIAAERGRTAALERDGRDGVGLETIAVVAGIGDRLPR